MTDRNAQFVDNPHDQQNWCQECGIYYCWHTEAMEKYPELRKKYGHHEMKHPFIPDINNECGQLEPEEVEERKYVTQEYHKGNRDIKILWAYHWRHLKSQLEVF